MNIFNKRNKTIEDDLPGFRDRPRPTLPPIEDELADTIRDQFKPGPITLDDRRKRLDFHLQEFGIHHDAARREATAYLEEHDAMVKELEAEKAKITAHLANLDKIAAGMPNFGGSDEKTPSDPNPGPDHNSGSGQTVPVKPIQGFNKPLSFDRR
jgi:hypothetical protein